MLSEQSKFAVKTSNIGPDSGNDRGDVLLLDRSEKSDSTTGSALSSSIQSNKDVDVVASFEKLQAKQGKDNWDKIAALAPIISAALIFLTGSYCTYTYNQQQIRIQECQTIEKFIPHLMGNEQTKKAAILALSTLINTETASKFAAIFASTGTVSALQSLSQSGSEKDKLIATQALSGALQNLADRESKLTSIEQDYKKALADRAEQNTADRDAPYNLNKLAQLYIIRGQYNLAEPLLKRSLTLREKIYGNEHPELVETLKSLAELYQLTGKSELAETTLKRAREIEEHERPAFAANPPAETARPAAAEANVNRNEAEKLTLPSSSGEGHANEPAGEAAHSDVKGQ
ncbi:MAG TPA: tetratricopeptide repeat protein [Oculatellaceae cyanobacterium]